MTPKKLGKALLCKLMEKQSRKLRQKYKFTVVAVAGSVGKTSTKLAIAKTLASSMRIRYQDGNYNDRLTVPLILFGHDQPGIFNLLAWAKILRDNNKQLRHGFPYDVVVVELGTDGPGQLRQFEYLRPDITVVTAIAAEHMEYFGNLDAVAREELQPLAYSAKVVLNIDDISADYLPATPFTTYGLTNGDYHLERRQSEGINGQLIELKLSNNRTLKTSIASLGTQGAKICLAAIAVADIIGLTEDQIKAGLAEVKPAAGRLQVLSGINNSTILDDTYNATPSAMKAALDVLQSLEAPQRIAILGSMNELGKDSAEMHSSVGSVCNSELIDLIVTVGSQASEHLAQAARAQGCKVETFVNPYQAGHFVADHLEEGAIILAKGSQNGVFAEEALKMLLNKPGDAQKLVRQSDEWLKIKRSMFGPMPPAPTESTYPLVAP
jgi:UDP-N-acetylmuramoyl-tripeptide--D-alanyl-D-alanine ligase